MKVTPDKYLTYRYAGASGDFNPIHLDDEFARSVGLPGKKFGRENLGDLLFRKEVFLPQKVRNPPSGLRHHADHPRH